MNEMELLSRWRAEIGRQLLDGAINVRLKDIAEATRAQVESPIPIPCAGSPYSDITLSTAMPVSRTPRRIRATPM
jgi:hypothetical protein